MKAAIIGGGSAGYIAASHLTRSCPDLELHHVYDPSIPTIGVGEGTVAGFPDWIDFVTEGMSFGELQARCHVTRKFGILFEGWGEVHEQFFHHFYPVGVDYAYHLSADLLVEMLRDQVRAERVSRRVAALRSDGERACLEFEDGSELEVDLCIDARGFPRSIDPDLHVSFDMIPTNTVLLRQTPQVRTRVEELLGSDRSPYESATRAVARPHGWIFIIPLTSRTSYGYVYNGDLNSVDEVARDFDDFFDAERVEWDGAQRGLRFPNFSTRSFFDGAVMKVGNSASFLEPLEATAIGFSITQLELLGYWPLTRWTKAKRRSPVDRRDLEVFNRFLRDYARKLAWFVTWHYAEGSAYRTPFWAEAKRRFRVMVDDPANEDLRTGFRSITDVAASLPHPMNDRTGFSDRSLAHDVLFGQWTPPSFAQIGWGIGYPLEGAARS